ncbi:hypothetical protein ACHAXM_005913 [Skeletonema potamos]|jgi:hypothetical protein
MASLLQKSSPWIEDSFVYAGSFDASRCYDDEANASDEDFNDDDEMEPQTENTIPAGLHDNDDDDDVSRRNRAPPSRGGKIVQIIDQGGDPNFYATEQQRCHDTSNECCPPYLILHDGQYSTIAFLSEEAYNSSMMRQNNAAAASVMRGGAKQRPRQIPRKSLITISQYTIATIKRCIRPKDQQQQQSNNTNKNNADMLTLQLVRPDMPFEHLLQIQSTLNTNLLLCLYLLGPITLIGAENQGLIGNTNNVNCSIKVRRVLLSHMAQFQKVHEQHTDACVNPEEEEVEDYQHWTMVQRLEACHCYYQLLKEMQGGMIPMWPWESRLVDGEKHDDNEDTDENSKSCDNVDHEGANEEVKSAAATSAIATAASPGRVERMIRKYENLEEFLQEEEDEEEGGDDSADIPDDDAFGDKRAERASTGTYLANWDSEEDPIEEEEKGGEEGNSVEQVQQQQQQQQGEGKGDEEDETEKASNAKKDDVPIEQGNVAELFENFENINDVLDLEEDSVTAEEGEASTSANTMFDSNENDNDVDNVPEQGEGNKTTEETHSTQDGNAATFVGIDQMIVDDDEEEEEEEEEDNDEQAPLLTQQEFHSYNDGETIPASSGMEVTESEIPLSTVEVDKQSTKLLRGDGHTMEHVESQIPLPPPKYAQFVDEENGEDIGTESQIPFPSRRNQQNALSSDESASEGEDIDGDLGTESQIPFPPRRNQQTQVCRHTCDHEEGMYQAESQVPLPQKQPVKKAGSPRKSKPDVSASKILMERPVRSKRADEIIYDSDGDDWMRIRKVKTSVKSPKKTPRVQSQIAGERSEESNPSLQIINSDKNEAEEEDGAGIPPKGIQQPTTGSASTARSHLPKRNAATSINTGAASTDHRVRFAIDNANQHSQPFPAAAAPSPPVMNERELFASVSNKASLILLQSSKVSSEPAPSKRKDCGDEGEIKKRKEFSFASTSDKAKRYCHIPDEEK